MNSLSQKHQNFVVLDSKMLIYNSKLRFFHLQSLILALFSSALSNDEGLSLFETAQFMFYQIDPRNPRYLRETFT